MMRNMLLCEKRFTYTLDCHAPRRMCTLSTYSLVLSIGTDPYDEHIS